MEYDRRSVLLGGLAATFANALPACAATPVRLYSAARIGADDGAACFSNGALQPFALPGRGHAFTRLSDDRALVCARRPGAFAAFIDTKHLGAPAVVAPSDGNRFAGHAALSPDGGMLVTSEFAAEGCRGTLVVRDPRDGSIRAQWNPQGVEPHELLFRSDGKTLVVAIGSLIKDGGVAGPAPNPDGIDSALIEVDPASGTILRRHALGDGLRSLSLRHIALSGDDVVVGMQDQDLSQPRPLMALLTGGELAPLPQPPQADCDFRGYVGSVAVTAGIAAAASPRGSVLGTWSVAERKWLGGVHIADVCGLTRGESEGELWASTGLGQVLHLAVDEKGPRILERWQVNAGFDNHLLRI